MDITNKSGKPLSVPLPGGKRLHLGPGKTGQVSDRALEHPPLVKLIEAGAIEKAGGGSSIPKDISKGQGGAAPGARHGGSGAMRQSGDR